MEFKFLESGKEEIEFMPSGPENLIIRSAIRKQLLAAATGEIVMEHEAAATLLHYIDNIGNDPSDIQALRCSRRHIGYFREAVESSLRDLTIHGLGVAGELVKALNYAETEIDAQKVGLIIPDFVPDNL